jgi:hypothetical protein
MFQVYDPKRMLVRRAVFDEIRLALSMAMARRGSRAISGGSQVAMSAVEFVVYIDLGASSSRSEFSTRTSMSFCTGRAPINCSINLVWSS